MNQKPLAETIAEAVAEGFTIQLDRVPDFRAVRIFVEHNDAGAIVRLIDEKELALIKIPDEALAKLVAQAVAVLKARRQAERARK